MNIEQRKILYQIVPRVRLNYNMPRLNKEENELVS